MKYKKRGVLGNILDALPSLTGQGWVLHVSGCQRQNYLIRMSHSFARPLCWPNEEVQLGSKNIEDHLVVHGWLCVLEELSQGILNHSEQEAPQPALLFESFPSPSQGVQVNLMNHYANTIEERTTRRRWWLTRPAVRASTTRFG
jgi:hypothetical protein